MEHDAILTFQAPPREGAGASCHPSPTMELLYAAHYLTARVRDLDERGFEVGWVDALLGERPELVRGIHAAAADADPRALGPVLLLLAARYGFERDTAPHRFLRELPGLPRRYVEAGDPRPQPPEGDDEQRVRHEQYAATMQHVAQEHVGGALAEALGRLWDTLGPVWSREGEGVVEHAVGEFQAAFERTGSVLAALPAHHFTRFEHLADGIRSAESRGRVTVIPLFFAASGGFSFDVDGRAYVGFGLQSESVFERRAHEVATLAGRVKALADPTRLMTLALVSDFSTIRLTVGDLAQQTGVSQPTISGHLKLLREAGLVDVQRVGNRSFYTLEREALADLLDGLRDTLLP
jgi:ArsR family transcriptional regulator, arsenate/arsenite/antimonite-responsive transcriptional repressor